MAGFASNSLPSPSSSPVKHRKPTSFLFGFTAFASKAFTDNDPVISPTSILDTKPLSALRNPFRSDSNTPKPNGNVPEFNNCDAKRFPWDKFDSKGVGLGIVDHLVDDEKSNNDDPVKFSSSTKPETSKLVVFGSQLKIQIPLITAFRVDSPKSPMEFGTKTKNSKLGLLSPSNRAVKCSHGSLSASEMELSEDYTCVIARGGTVTKMTRIFDNCIVESCFGSDEITYSRKEENGFPGSMSYPSQSFLSFCYTCKKNLGHGRDIYMYRGEKAFCSDECRRLEIKSEEEIGEEGSW